MPLGDLRKREGKPGQIPYDNVSYRRLYLFMLGRYSKTMQRDTVRTSLDLPRDLHRRLHEAAARRGCSARQLLLESIEDAVSKTEPPARPPRRLSLDPPIIPGDGRKLFDLTNEQIYDLIEFP